MALFDFICVIGLSYPFLSVLLFILFNTTPSLTTIDGGLNVCTVLLLPDPCLNQCALSLPAGQAWGARR